MSTQEEKVVEEETSLEKEEKGISISSSSPEEKPLSKKEEREHAQKELFDAFLQELEEQIGSAEKLQFTIHFMETMLSQSSTPQFRNFWEARKVCLQLFKENISPLIRAQLWTKYRELSREARRLKEILDEQTAFAVEQIEMAIQALEEDLDKLALQLDKLPSIEFPKPSKFMEQNFDFYNKIQRELNLLNAHVARINGLRKELVKTEMRIRQKNRFFQRLSSSGDKVFPCRKELIKKVSEQFVSDVNAFIEDNFSTGKLNTSLLVLREEIKSLQGIAKILTLNTQAFTQTRMRLSDCWEKIKQTEKERKKEKIKQKALFKKNANAVSEKVEAFSAAFQAGEFPVEKAEKEISGLTSFMKSCELDSREFKRLKEQLQKARMIVKDKAHEEEKQRQNENLEREHRTREKVGLLKKQITALVENSKNYDIQKLETEQQAFVKQIEDDSLISKSDKEELLFFLEAVNDVLSEKKATALLSLSKDEQEYLDQLKGILQQHKEHRQEIKHHLDWYRKAIGASGLDFQQALNYHSRQQAEKERLERANRKIQEIEQKIAEAKSKK